MREILYRGKRLDTGEWVKGYFVEFLARYHRSDKMGCYIQTIKEDGGLDLIHEVDPETVGQYTGLKDKNGKRIFEGDICQINLFDALPFVIEWEDFVYNGWTWRDLDEVGLVDSFTSGTANCCEKIGNIHDNHDLLGGNNG